MSKPLDLDTGRGYMTAMTDKQKNDRLRAELRERKTEVADLNREYELGQRRIAELKDEIDRLRALVKRAYEDVLESKTHLIENWIQALDLERDAEGLWGWPEKRTPWDLLAEWADKYNQLLRDWNKFVPEYNDAVRPPRKVGRPIAATEEQIADVKKRRARGRSLREIAEDTGLSLRTVRTIVEKEIGLCRVHLERIAMDRNEIRRIKAKQQAAAAIPKRINSWLEEADEFVSEAREG
jgi:ribosomal protein L13E